MNTKFQNRVAIWTANTFGAGYLDDIQERRLRFLEEAIELFQACGGTPSEVVNVEQHVFSRLPGEVFQEIGQVMITLASLSECKSASMGHCAMQELVRLEILPAEYLWNKYNSKPSNIRSTNF